jgi:hypothetical protein
LHKRSEFFFCWFFFLINFKARRNHELQIPNVTFNNIFLTLKWWQKKNLLRNWFDFLLNANSSFCRFQFRLIPSWRMWNFFFIPFYNFIVERNVDRRNSMSRDISFLTFLHFTALFDLTPQWDVNWKEKPVRSLLLFNRAKVSQSKKNLFFLLSFACCSIKHSLRFFKFFCDDEEKDAIESNRLNGQEITELCLTFFSSSIQCCEFLFKTRPKTRVEWMDERRKKKDHKQAITVSS